jgi:hypothetical protein
MKLRERYPYSEGETSILNERSEGFNDETGPYLITLSSPHLTVGGLLHLSVTLGAAPETGLIIHNVTGKILQSHVLTSPKDRTKTKVVPPHERSLLHVDRGSPLRWPGEPDQWAKSGNRPMPIISIEPSAVVGESGQSSPRSPTAPSSNRGRQGRSKSRDRKKQFNLPRDGEFLAVLGPGEAFKLSHLARMPLDG